MHEAAKEMVQLAEQGYMRREQASDPAWQEMLNHATMKVSSADLSTRMVRPYFVRLRFQHDKIGKLTNKYRRKYLKQDFFFLYIIINISGHVLPFLCFPVQDMPSSGFLAA